MGRAKRLIQIGFGLLAAQAQVGCEYVSVSPSAYCSGSIVGDTYSEKLDSALEHCAPMLRVTVDTRVFYDTDGQDGEEAGRDR